MTALFSASSAPRLSSVEGRLVVDGRPAFLLADTAWSAMSEATDDEWHYYLYRRSKQGFNGVLVSVLPILHDRSGGGAGLYPFDEESVRSHSRWSFERRYFERLQTRLDIAREHGVVCALVVLWVNYVAGTWGAERTPGFVMPAGAREEYLQRLGCVVGDGECLLVVSGDAGFASEQEVEAYRDTAEAARKVWPASIMAFHSGPTAFLPQALDSFADILIFQSGHHGESPHLARELASRYSAIASGRPVMNAEPCYEAHRVGGGVGRFGRQIVRRRSWETIVSGASAGLAYGAHGLWGWHRGGKSFSSVHFSGTPLDWRDALSLHGADDAAQCRHLMEDLGLPRLEPRQEVLKVLDKGWGANDVVVGLDATSGLALVYLPNGGPVTLGCERNLEASRVIDLNSFTDVGAAVEPVGAGAWVVDPPGSVPEALLVLRTT